MASRHKTTARKASASQETLGKWPGETHREWQDRLDRADLVRRYPGEPLIPVEAQAHGDYADSVVTHLETNTRAQTKRNRQQSALGLMHEWGAISPAQFEAASQIARIAESIERAVSLRGARLEPRVDCGGSARDMLTERLSQVRLEMTYNRWRDRLPMPRRMVIDMVISDRDLVATARVHNVPWREARRRLIAALDLWLELREAVWREIDADDAGRAYRQLGEGRLT
jgi:hypothetical protein